MRQRDFKLALLLSVISNRQLWVIIPGQPSFKVEWEEFFQFMGRPNREWCSYIIQAQHEHLRDFDFSELPAEPTQQELQQWLAIQEELYGKTLRITCFEE